MMGGGCQVFLQRCVDVFVTFIECTLSWLGKRAQASKNVSAIFHYNIYISIKYVNKVNCVIFTFVHLDHIRRSRTGYVTISVYPCGWMLLSALCIDRHA